MPYTARGGGQCALGFLVIGQQKCGTSSLYSWLQQHPSLTLPAVKEHFAMASARAEDCSERAVRKYLSDIAVAPASCARSSLTGDFTASLLSCGCCPPVLHRALGAAGRLIVVLRNPIDRALSRFDEQAKLQYARSLYPHPGARSFRSSAGGGVARFTSFDQHVDVLLPVLEACLLQHARDGGARDGASGAAASLTCARIDDVLGFSLYAPFVANWLRVFARSALLVLVSEAMDADPEAALRSIEAHISVPPHVYSGLSARFNSGFSVSRLPRCTSCRWSDNSSSHVALHRVSSRTRARLASFYGAWQPSLIKLVGEPLSADTWPELRPPPSALTPHTGGCRGGVLSPQPWPLSRLERPSPMETCRSYSPPLTVLQQPPSTLHVNVSAAQPSLSSAVHALLDPSNFTAASADASFVVFLAHARSGHSLIAALLDAHPHAIIANEVDLVGAFERMWREDRPVTRERLLRPLLENSVSCGLLGRYQTGYLYSVPHSYQGQWSCRVDAIGDKKPFTAVLNAVGDSDVTHRHALSKRSMRRSALLLGGLIDALQVRSLKVIAVRTNDRDGYVARIARALRDEMPWPRPNIHGTTLSLHEVDDFACKPREQLMRLCEFLGLEHDAAYLEAAVAQVNPKYCKRTGARTMAQRKAGCFAVSNLSSAPAGCSELQPDKGQSTKSTVLIGALLLVLAVACLIACKVDGSSRPRTRPVLSRHIQ